MSRAKIVIGFITVSLALGLLFTVLPAIADAPTVTEFPICINSSPQNNPVVCGDIVVWQDSCNGDWDIYGYNLTLSSEFSICTNSAQQIRPDLSGGIVVWEEWRNVEEEYNTDIYGYNLSSSTEFPVCTNLSDQRFPAICDDIVVWEDYRNGGMNPDIYGYNMSSFTEFPVCTNTSGQYNPAVWGDIVVWEDLRNGNEDIYGYNLSSSTEFSICTNSSLQTHPVIWHDMIFWCDNRNGSGDIYGCNLSSPGEFAVCTNLSDQTYPSIWGDIVVWEDYRNGWMNPDIYGYNLSSSTDFTVCVNSSAQYMPAIWSNTVVWDDLRNYGNDIYGATLEWPTPTPSPTVSPTASPTVSPTPSPTESPTPTLSPTAGYSLITFGSEYVFNTGYGVQDLSAASLSSDKFVVTYRDDGNISCEDCGTAVIGDISGTNITFGSEHIFNNFNQTSFTSVAALSDTKFVIAYQNDCYPSYYGVAVIGEVSGSNISFGSGYVFNLNVTASGIIALSSDRFAMVYDDYGNGTAIIGDVSGTNITFGSEYVFNPNDTYPISAAALSDSKFVVAYRDWGNSAYGTAVIGDVSGTAISYGSEYVFNPSNTGDTSTAALSSTQFVVAYRDIGNSDYGTAIIGDVSDTVICFGPEDVFNPAGTDYNSGAALSDSRFVVAYQDNGNFSYGTAIIGGVSGNTTTVGSESVFSSEATYEIAAAALSATKFVVAFDGAAVIGLVITPTPTPTPTSVPNPGDVNDDGVINCIDITQCELCILYPETYPKENYPGWDANEDTTGPNAGDILAVEMRILGTWPPE